MPKKLPESQSGPPDGDHFTAVLQTKRSVLTRRLASLREQAAAIAEEETRVETQLGHINALLDEQHPEQPRATEEATTSSDSSFADQVAALLRDCGEPLHYRQIAQKLLERGVILPKGKDPAANLLAYFFNDPRFYRPHRGTYALRDGRTVQSVGTRRAQSLEGEPA